MKSISILEIKKAVIRKLDREFGYEVYGEEIKQGFQEPCFFISLLEPSEKQLLSNRYKRTHEFDVHFFPVNNENMQQQAFEMGEELYQVLEYIEVGNDLYKGTKMHMKYTDGVLHFFVHYNFHVVKPVQEVKMDDIKQIGGIKNGTK